MTTLAPKPFDVVFSGGKGEWQSFLSLVVQPLGDAKALRAPARFSHVSLVLDDQFALEAVPVEPNPETGAFTGSALAGGVRLIPIVDLLFSVRNHRGSFAVLRSANAGHSSLDIDPRTPTVLHLLASEYSLKGLVDAAETRLGVLPEALKKRLRATFNWSAPPRDIGSQLAGDEVRRSLERAIPGYTFPFKSSSFFCSKLVTELISTGGLATFQDRPEGITPTGLFVRLLEQPDWSAVTDSDYASAALDSAFRASPDSCRLAHERLVQEVRMLLHTRGLWSVADLLDAGSSHVNAKMQEFLKLTQSLGWAEPERQRARNYESEVVDDLVQQAAIVDPTRREVFRRNARDVVRMFGLGLLDYGELLEQLVEAAAE